jgi:hypothetical protein
MFGSPHLTISYLFSCYEGDERQGPVSKSWIVMKALAINTNSGSTGHVQGWCIGASINMS